MWRDVFRRAAELTDGQLRFHGRCLDGWVGRFFCCGAELN
jgi:hypothetical protein